MSNVDDDDDEGLEPIETSPRLSSLPPDDDDGIEPIETGWAQRDTGDGEDNKAK